MAKLDREGGLPFLYPVCLHSATESPSELAQMVMAHALVTNGRDQIRKHGKRLARKDVSSLSEQHDAGLSRAFEEHEMRVEHVPEIARRTGFTFEEVLFALGILGGAANAADAQDAGGSALMPGFNLYDWRSLAVAVAMAPGSNHAARQNGEDGRLFGLGLDLRGCIWTMGGLLSYYDRAARWVATYEKAVGKKSSTVRMRRTLVVELINGSARDLREFRVYAAVRCGLGRRKWKALSLDWLRYMADGYAGEDAFLAFDAEAARTASAPRTAGPEVSDVLLDADGPAKMAESLGVYRFDRARTLHVEHGLADGGVPFTGDGGAFDVRPTARGVAFVLREDRDILAGVPLGASPPLARDFAPGDRVVFATGTAGGALLVGVVTRADEKRRTLTVERAGQVYTVSRSKNWVTPAALVPGADAALGRLPAAGQTDDADDDAPRREPSLTVSQMRTTLGKLGPHGRKFFAHATDGRRAFFGVGVSQAELEALVFGKQARNMDRRHEQAMQRLRHQEAVEAKRAELAAERAATADRIRRLRERPGASQSDRASVAQASPKDRERIAPNSVTSSKLDREQQDTCERNFLPLGPGGPARAGDDDVRMTGLFGPPALSRQPSASALGQNANIDNGVKDEPFVLPDRTASPAASLPDSDPDVPPPGGAAPPPPGLRRVSAGPPSSPPPGALTGNEAHARAMAHGEVDIWPIYGFGGRFRQVVLANGSACYVERDAAEVAAERAQIERERAGRNARGAAS